MYVLASIGAFPFEAMFGTKMYSRPEHRMLQLLDNEQKTQFMEERHEVPKLNIYQE